MNTAPPDAGLTLLQAIASVFGAMLIGVFLAWWFFGRPRWRCVERGCADDGRLPIARTEDDAAEIHDDPVLPTLVRSKAWR